MRTALDSNILIDLIGARTGFSDAAVVVLDEARMAGAMIVCPVVVAEISAHFPTVVLLTATLRDMGISLVDLTLADAHRAGSAFVACRRRSAKPKERMLADFLVGAHALHHADRLLTRDRGYYRTYFPRLKLVEPRAP